VKNNKSFVDKMCNRPPKNNFSRFVLQPPPPRWNFSTRAKWVQAGLGLGVQGHVELGLGGQGVPGRLPDHSLRFPIKYIIEILSSSPVNCHQF